MTSWRLRDELSQAQSQLAAVTQERESEQARACAEELASDADIATGAAQRSKLQQQLQQAKTDGDELNDKLAAVREELAKSQSRVSELESQLAAVTQERDELSDSKRAEAAKAAEELASLHADIATGAAQRSKLQQQLQQAKTDSDELSDQLKSSREECSRLQDSLASVQADLSASQAAHASTEQQLTEVTATAASVRNELADMTQERDTLADKLRQTETSAAEELARVMADVAALSAQRSKLQQDLQGALSSDDEKAQHLQSLSDQLAAASQERDALAAQIVALQADSDSRDKSQRALLESSRAEAEAAEKVGQALKQRVSLWEQQLATEPPAVAALREERSNSNREAALELQIMEYASRLSVAEQDIARLAEALREAETTSRRAMDEAAANAAAMQERLTEQQTQLADVRLALAKEQGTVAELQTSLSALEADHSALQATHAATTQQLGETQQRLRDALTDAEQARQVVADTEAEMVRVKIAAESQMQAAQRLVTDAQRAIRDKADILDSASAERHDWVDKLASAQTEHMEAIAASEASGSGWRRRCVLHSRSCSDSRCAPMTARLPCAAWSKR